MTDLVAANQSWEEVLAAVEADVERTENLLSGEPDRYLAPAQWQLPEQHPDLPPLDEMPAVPEELRDRIHELRVRIVALQVELATELASVRASRSGPLARAAALRPAPPVPADARYVDTRL